MRSPGLSLPPDAIRIEDEVWQEAFTRREPARPRADRLAAATLRSGETRRQSAAASAPRARSAPGAADLLPPASDPVPRPASTPARLTTAPTGRRTVTITGRGAERHLPWPGDPGHRPARRPRERAGFRPDRVAMWAVFLGILLVAVAVASPHG
jgi:hypothetical protein